MPDLAFALMVIGGFSLIVLALRALGGRSSAPGDIPATVLGVLVAPPLPATRAPGAVGLPDERGEADQAGRTTG